MKSGSGGTQLLLTRPCSQDNWRRSKMTYVEQPGPDRVVVSKDAEGWQAAMWAVLLILLAFGIVLMFNYFNNQNALTSQQLQNLQDQQSRSQLSQPLQQPA